MEKIVKNPKKILVVDDDRNVLFLMSELLARENYEIIQASDGLAALKLVRQLLPELAVLDVMMPGLDGFELCRRIKNDPLTSGIKVIMVTAKTLGKDIETGLSAGADHYITKPFKISELSTKIKELIG
ncbi:response regulator [candidate division TA06 bacterium]|uniref:Response regulator n=1 Tax=candidate division TA06 bacterium TaxID=2250710 RepID=A0A933IAD6_UNCT6|nr:response regulator [candidate division TA06 bacterium]